MSPELVAAFMTGIASVLGAGWSLRRAHNEERKHCDARIAEIREVYERGMDKGLRLTEAPVPKFLELDE